MPQSRKLRPSSTAGKMKGQNCQKSVAKNYYCGSRSHKNDKKLFFQGCMEVSKIKGNLPTQEVIEARELGLI